MDLAYLRAHPDHLPTFLTHQRIRETPVHGGFIAVASRLTLDDGASIFAKRWPDEATSTTPRQGRPATRPDGFFEAEAHGIEWLGVDGGAPLPEVIASRPDLLALEWIDEGAPTAAAARAFGAALARTHRAGAAAFGAPWPGYIGSLPLDNRPFSGSGDRSCDGSADTRSDDTSPPDTGLSDIQPPDASPPDTEPPDTGQPRNGPATNPPADRSPDTIGSAAPWSAWFAERRLVPYLRMSVDRGALDATDAAALEALIADIASYAGEADAEPPARIHGDLWPGNLLWSAAGPVYLIDPAAHGGHRESDLAQLSLFGGAPYLGDMIAGYQGEWPLSPGWAARVPLHQLHLLLVHTALFGAGYRDVVRAAARATVEL